MTDAVLRKFVVAGLLAGMTMLSACTYWHGDLERIADESERDFRRNVPGPFTEVDLKELVSSPTAYKYNWVRFNAVLNRKLEMGYVPFLTTFDPENYVAFSVWPGDAKLWQTEDRAHAFPHCFVRRNSEMARELLSASRFSLVRISAMVMGDYELKPWLEVNRIEVLEPAVYTDDALIDLALAKEAVAAKKPALAIRHYENSLGGIWTTGLRLDIHLALAGLYEGRGDVESALNHYKGALTNDPENAEALKGVDRNKAALEAKENPPAPQQ